MFLKFYTLKQTLLSNPRCVVPYYEWQIFKTGATTNILPSLITGNDASTYGRIVQSTLPQGLSDTQLTSSNIQLQSIPERIYIFVRRTRQNLTCCDTDAYLSIKNIRVNFNNNSGLLSTFTPEQLYLSTITDGGIKNLTWDEFKGITISACGNGAPAYATSSGLYNAQPFNPYTGYGANGDGLGIKLVPTTGSILALGFGSTIQLSEDFYAAGSIGQFNLQVILNVANYTKDIWNDYELVILVQNSGVLITDRGSSSTFVGMLTKDAVLATKDESDFYTTSYAKHMMGGSWMHHLKSGARWLHEHGISKAKNFLKEHVDHPITNKIVDAASALGYGMTGAGHKGKLADRLL